jgi:hypothetical protein
MFLLTGCVQKYDYSEAQSDEAAEYIAGVLLKNDKDYTQELMPLDELTGDNSADSNDPATIPTKAPNYTKDNASTSATEAKKECTLSEVLGKENLNLQYSGYKIMDTYPEVKSPENFSITPDKGNQLMLISFELTNTSKKDMTVDLTEAKLTYQLNVNNGTIYEPSFTVLENDLKYLKTSLKGGKGKQVLLVVEVRKEPEIQNINLTVSSVDKTNIIKMK